MWGRPAWTILGGTALVAGLVAVALVVVAVDEDPVQVAPGPATTTTLATVATTTSSTVPATTATTNRPPPTSSTVAPAAPRTLRRGATGPDVAELQRRLVALGYLIGAEDGVFSDSTMHAVVAFQKATGLPRDGIVGPATLERLNGAARPSPRSTAGRTIEVDLDRQILLVVADGRTEWVIDASTGSQPGTTPIGQFRVYYEVDGYDTGPLGVLYRPKYVVRGVAVHGYASVPPWPASHGCVRVTNAAMDWIWASGAMAMGTPVWIY